MRLIDADALKEAVNTKRVVGRFNTIQLIDNAPTVFDCRSCKNNGNERECVDCHEYSNFVKYEDRPQDKWIPVSERLPERHKAVIVTDIETSDTYQSQYIGNGYWDCDNGTLKNRIIAWMPLPEAYKEEEEDE